jgi:creatinine amidohydrolase
MHHPRTLAAVLLALLLPLAGGTHGLAAGPAVVEIERMTWLEVRDRIAGGATTIIIPTGGTEQNGAHMALGKHNLIVAETSRRIARALGDALVAPVLAYVPEGDIEKRSGHMAYAGTISVPDAVYMQLLEAAAASFKAHGFNTIVLLGDSGGNQPPQQELARKLTRSWAGEGVRVLNADAYYFRNGGDDWLRSQGETGKTLGTHAGIRDTSELMAVDASAVDLSKAQPEANGATGDARRASAARGEALLQQKVEAAVAEIRASRSGERASVERKGWLSWIGR